MTRKRGQGSNQLRVQNLLKIIFTSPSCGSWANWTCVLAHRGGSYPLKVAKSFLHSTSMGWSRLIPEFSFSFENHEAANLTKHLLSDAEGGEDQIQDIVRRRLAR